MSVSVTTGLLVLTAFTCRFQLLRAAEGVGTLEFVTLSSPTTLPRSDDASSDQISTNGDFPFGFGTISTVYVSTNGYISMGTPPIITKAPSLPGSENILSPYGAGINTSIAGTVKYMPFTTSHQDIGPVSSFVQLLTGLSSFRGTRMMAVEWSGVAQRGGSSSTTSTFQAVLITNEISSFAVFIYQCGAMEWGGATIGWAYSGSLYEKHFLSGSESARIGCEISPSYTAILYRLSRSAGCQLHEFSCADGSCIYYYNMCNDRDDCGDNSDETICGELAVLHDRIFLRLCNEKYFLKIL
ncbi:Alpha-tectorin [Geodia barretti]|uniref:Alpha-tectorin n=1 Tax=Geodia barretti TaxID=519541 RepID=A0AA35WNL5_GEOBA|nr:Alpha-tectorin [Geodia barretti]